MGNLATQWTVYLFLLAAAASSATSKQFANRPLDGVARDPRAWRPLNYGNPLIRDPTLFYLPPMIERVHIGPGPPRLPHREPLFPIRPRNPTVLLNQGPSATSRNYGPQARQALPDPARTQVRQNVYRPVAPRYVDNLLLHMDSSSRDRSKDDGLSNTRNIAGRGKAFETSQQEIKGRSLTQRNQRNRPMIPLSDLFIQQGHSKVKKYGT